MTTGNWNVGSIADHVGILVGWSNIPTSISGTALANLISQEINFVEQFTSDTISDNAILEKYQPPIIDLSLSKLLFVIETNQGGVENIKLGDLSVSAGNNSSVVDIAKRLREGAILRLKELQRAVRFKRVIGGDRKSVV